MNFLSSVQEISYSCHFVLYIILKTKSNRGANSFFWTAYNTFILFSWIDTETLSYTTPLPTSHLIRNI